MDGHPIYTDTAWRHGFAPTPATHCDVCDNPISLDGECPCWKTENAA